MRWYPHLPSRPPVVPSPRRLLAVLGPDAASAAQSFVALAINTTTSLVAGAMLGSIDETFTRYPGLLVMVPAAIGLRGNVFSALGSRVSSSIHTGDYHASLRPGSVMADNATTSLALTAALSLALAVLADIVSIAFGVARDVSVLTLVTISVLGGLLASGVVLSVTLALVTVAVRREWDLDNLVAPVVSTLGDVVTVPALYLATGAVGHGSASTVLGVLLAAGALAASVQTWRSHRERVRRILRESLPVLTVAALLSTLAGVVLEKRLDTFAALPAILVLVPAFVSSAGALGGLLASRLATNLHLGTVEPAMWPTGALWRDVRVLAALAVPIYVINGAGAHGVSLLLGEASPGLASLVSASLLGAVGAVAFVIVVAYYGSVAAVRFGLDPDTYGIPVVTSSVDFVGAAALMTAVVAMGIA